jgi:signal transduction histidine kinase
MTPSRPPALRLWLQSSALVAVLAGYGLLLGAGSLLAAVDRRLAHQQLVASLAEEFQAAAGPTAGQIALLRQLGVEVRVEAAAAPQPPRLRRSGNTIWLTSRTNLQSRGLPARSLLVRQNITAPIERERQLLLLLLAAAGLASLFTSALLREVLRRGLVLPIEAFCRQLERISSPSSRPTLLPEANQPSELRPIAASFNEMQRRLADAWNHERIFTDGVAHELRTPITLISGKAQSLLRQSLAPHLRMAVQAIAAEADHMTALVRDLLDLARQDGQRLQLACRPVDPESLLLEAYDRLRPLAPERLRLVIAGNDDGNVAGSVAGIVGGDEPSLPAVQADPARLLQCVSALVDNALAYSSGAVELELRGSPGQVVWHVRDHGPGVHPGERNLIFGRFARGSAAAGCPKRGSGLGLAVVKLLMEAMGGGVAVAAADGGGADFQLLLPLAGAERGPAGDASLKSPGPAGRGLHAD